MARQQTDVIQVGDLIDIATVEADRYNLSRTEKDTVRRSVNKLNSHLLLLKAHADEVLGFFELVDPRRSTAGEICDIADRLTSVAERLEAVIDQPTAPFSGTETILVVDDEEGMTAFLAASLRGRGYRVLEAASGQEAIERFKEENGKIDLILTDVEMSPINGYDLVDSLRSESPQIPALFISGLAPQRPLLGPGVDFLKKPFPKPRAHIEKVWRLLNQT